MDNFPTIRYRSIRISDIHLGARGSKVEYVLDFLRRTECETLYMVGDILDGWRLRKTWYCLQTHNDVVQKLLRKARKGTSVVLIPGNHDEFLRDYTGVEFGHIPIHKYAIHEAPDGRKYLVTHGDQFDGIVTYAKWLALMGTASIPPRWS